MQQWLCRTAKHVRKKARKWDLSAIRSTRIQMNHQKVSKDVHPTSVSVNLAICLTRLFPQEGGRQCLKIKLHLFCGEKKAPALLLCRTPLAGTCGCSIYQALGFWAQTKLITVPPSALVAWLSALLKNRPFPCASVLMWFFPLEWWEAGLGALWQTTDTSKNRGWEHKHEWIEIPLKSLLMRGSQQLKIRIAPLLMLWTHLFIGVKGLFQGAERTAKQQQPSFAACLRCTAWRLTRSL